jgi:transposase
MKDVELYGRVRYAVRIEGLSERAAARRFGIDPRTVNKMMKFSVPPGYVRKKPPAKPKLDPFIPVIDSILRDDKPRPKKQQHTAKRIFERLRDEHGFTGGITIVKDYVAGWRQRAQEMFVPLVHPPGHAQADFGEAIGVIGGVERKIHFFAFDLPHSDACFVVGYPAETTEAFCDGHVRAFAFFGGVPKSIRTTTPRSRWPASSVTASGNGHACSPSCNRTICSRIGSAGLAKATTRAKSKGSSAMRDGTSSYQSRCSRASRR